MYINSGMISLRLCANNHNYPIQNLCAETNTMKSSLSVATIITLGRSAFQSTMMMMMMIITWTYLLVSPALQQPLSHSLGLSPTYTVCINMGEKGHHSFSQVRYYPIFILAYTLVFDGFVESSNYNKAVTAVFPIHFSFYCSNPNLKTISTVKHKGFSCL